MRAELIAAAIAFALIFVERAAGAGGSVQSYPEEGSEAIGRGGAWVARASDPIAIARNPAGLAGQPLRLSAGADVAIRHACFTRLKAAGDATDDGVAPGASYGRVCDSASPIPVGFLAVNVPLSSRASVAAGIVTPHGIGRGSWPAFDGGSPSPQRYLLLESTALMAVPTIGAAYEVVPGLRLGASVGWGIAWVKTSAAAPALAQDGIRPGDDDVKVTVTAADLFVPRATAGAHASLGPWVELGGMFTWSAPIEARGDATTEANAFGARAASGDGSAIVHGDTSQRDCGQPGGSACGDGGNAHLTIPIPMEAQIGVRVRIPRAADAPAAPRDPMESEIGDVEIDATWSNDSAIDRYGLRFSPNIPVPGTPGTLPVDVASERRFRDVVGFRAGGDWNVLPGAAALRAGGFFEPGAGVPGSTGLEAITGARTGVSLGATARIRSGHGRAFDVTVAWLHVFVADVVASDPRADGTHAVTGVPPYRTRWPIGLGTIEDGLDVLHLGVAHRF